jgi:hypothetical protein
MFLFGARSKPALTGGDDTRSGLCGFSGFSGFWGFSGFSSGIGKQGRSKPHAQLFDVREKFRRRSMTVPSPRAVTATAKPK